MKEEIKDITDDLLKIPFSAEKIALELIKKLLQLKIDGVVYLRNQEEIDKILEILKLEIEKLTSQATDQLLIKLKSKTKISHAIMCLKKLIKEIRPLNIREIVRLVTKAAEGNALISGQDAALFIGETGKSATIQFLAGCKMEHKKVEIKKNCYKKHIEAISFPDNPTLVGVVSSCSNRSETKYIKPVKLLLKEAIGPEEIGEINLCDAAGYGDTAGPEVDIGNSVGMINAIKLCKSVKVIALLSSKNTGDRGQGIRKLSHILANLIENIEGRLDSILYLFTKYPSDFNAYSELSDLRKSLSNTDDDLEKDSAFMIVINDQKTFQETILIDLINGDPKTVLHKIKNLDGIKYPYEVFKYGLNKDSHDTIKIQVLRDQKNINIALKHQDSDLVLFYLKNSKALKDLIEKDFLNKAYNESVNFVPENLQKFCQETKVKFYLALDCQEGLKEEKIQEYSF